MGRIALAGIAFAVIAACGGNPAAPTPPRFGQPFELRLGSRALLEDGAFFGFVDVPSDSRCPTDATCVSAGQALVDTILGVRTDPGQPRFGVVVFINGLPVVDGVVVPIPWCTGDEVHTDCRLSTSDGKSVATTRKYSIRLVDLKPYPRAAVRVVRTDYVGTFAVALL